MRRASPAVTGERTARAHAIADRERAPPPPPPPPPSELEVSAGIGNASQPHAKRPVRAWAARHRPFHMLRGS